LRKRIIISKRKSVDRAFASYRPLKTAAEGYIQTPFSGFV